MCTKSGKLDSLIPASGCHTLHIIQFCLPCPRVTSSRSAYAAGTSCVPDIILPLSPSSGPSHTGFHSHDILDATLTRRRSNIRYSLQNAARSRYCIVHDTTEHGVTHHVTGPLPIDIMSRLSRPTGSYAILDVLSILAQEVYIEHKLSAITISNACQPVTVEIRHRFRF